MALRSEAEQNKYIFEQWAFKGPVVDKDAIYQAAQRLVTTGLSLPERTRSKVTDFTRQFTAKESPPGKQLRTVHVLGELLYAFDAADVREQQILANKITFLGEIVGALQTIQEAYVVLGVPQETAESMVDTLETRFLTPNEDQMRDSVRTIFSTQAMLSQAATNLLNRKHGK